MRIEPLLKEYLRGVPDSFEKNWTTQKCFHWLMRKRDNNCGERLTDIELLNIGDLSSIANRNLIDLQRENPDLSSFS